MENLQQEQLKMDLDLVAIICSPPIFCLGTNVDTTFYSLILPIIVILMVGMIMLITIFWIIHRVSTCISGIIIS